MITDLQFRKAQVVLLLEQIDRKILGGELNLELKHRIIAADNLDQMAHRMERYTGHPHHNKLLEYALNGDMKLIPSKVTTLQDIFLTMHEAMSLCTLHDYYPEMPPLRGNVLSVHASDLLLNAAIISGAIGDGKTILWSMDDTESNVTVFPQHYYDRAVYFDARHGYEHAIHFAYFHGWLFLISIDDVRHLTRYYKLFP